MDDREKKIIEALGDLGASLAPSDLKLVRQKVLAHVRSLPVPRRTFWTSVLIILQSKSMPIVLAIVLALGISGGTVAAAQNDLPDEPLYPVKLWSERAAERLAMRPEKKAELAERFAERRAEEVEGLLTRGPKKGTPREHFVRAVERMSERLDIAQEKLEALAEKNPDRALVPATKLQARIDAITNAAMRLEERVGDDDLAAELRPLKEKLEATEDAAEAVVDAVERQASPEGLLRSARGMYGALERKSAEIIKKYQRLVDAGVTVSAEVEAYLEQADGKKSEAKVALDAGEYRKAFQLAKESLRFYAEVGLRMNMEGAKYHFDRTRERREERQEERREKPAAESTDGDDESENDERGEDDDEENTAGASVDLQLNADGTLELQRIIE